MKLDSKTIVTTTRVAHDISEDESSVYFDMSDEEKIDIIAARILERYKSAFEELAK